ncbi:MAG: hypothetical protein R3A80_01005 [Bdellovibrionota bacterium]
MKHLTAIFSLLFIGFLSAGTATKKETKASSSAPKVEVKAPKAEEKTFNEEEFKGLMRDWNDKVLKVLENGKVPQGIFELAEKIIKVNPDMISVLAEDLSESLKQTPSLIAGIRKQWLPHSTKPLFVGSSGETLFEMAERLAKDGNG